MTSILKTDKIEGVTASGTVQMPAGTTVQAQSLPNSGRGAFTYTTSSSFAAMGTNWDLTITPKFASSKILLLGNFSCKMEGGANKYGYITLYRVISGGATTDLGDINSSGLMAVDGQMKWTNAKIQYLDSPNTTSSITYKPYYRSSDGSNEFYVGWSSSSSANHNLTFLTALEIAQ
tara:strand:+ start:959 stop:1486 length:528 start_codon:yes stop_codon:yes gene_type:complete